MDVIIRLKCEASRLVQLECRVCSGRLALLATPKLRRRVEATRRQSAVATSVFGLREYRRGWPRARAVSNWRDVTCCSQFPANLRYCNATAAAVCGIGCSGERKGPGLVAIASDGDLADLLAGRLRFAV